jgi:hypothetical protein
MPIMSAVTSHREGEAYIADLGAQTRSLAEAAHRVLVTLGCESYVKTIYVGYAIDGEMVAAMYGHPDRLEVALALPEDTEHGLLIDASHLTWPTLPVAAIVRSTEDLPLFESLAIAASSRVRSGSHDVRKDSEFFSQRRMGRRRRDH